MPRDGLGPVEKNLAFRAAVAYTEATGWPDGFAIEIDKRIPVGGGLGGGSADAGAVLRALDALSPNPLGSRLVELATPLGADVPFMTIDSPMALAWGRGERLLPIHPLEPRPVLLAIPEFSVATADAYAWLSSDRGRTRPPPRSSRRNRSRRGKRLPPVAANDFEHVVARRHSVIDRLADELDTMGRARRDDERFGVDACSGSSASVPRLRQRPLRPGSSKLARASGCSRRVGVVGPAFQGPQVHWHGAI